MIQTAKPKGRRWPMATEKERQKEKHSDLPTGWPTEMHWDFAMPRDLGSDFPMEKRCEKRKATPKAKR